MQTLRSVPITARPVEGDAADAPASYVAWAPQGRRLAVPAGPGAIQLVDTDTDTAASGPTVDGLVNQVAWSPSGTRLAAAGGDDGVFVWEPGRPLRAHDDWVGAIAWSPTGSRLASGARDHRAMIWEPGADRPRHVLTGHTGEVTAVSWAADGYTLATGSADATVRLWSDGRCLRTWQHPGPVRGIAWSPDGRVLAAATGTHVAFHPAADRPALTGHTGPVHEVSWSPDGRHLGTTSADGTVRLWDAAGRTPLAVLDVDDGRPAFAFHPALDRIAVWTRRAGLSLWDFSPA
ncbi:WD40 repeat domain-containing protein [Actinoplanes sp. NPDC051494]|uniref:WD40 repeat domain-containing protein n=1 Tax=Actinoplanes sp. NPDC051494 TaxID=3363907 RepID=UPI0037AE4B48